MAPNRHTVSKETTPLAFTEVAPGFNFWKSNQAVITDQPQSPVLVLLFTWLFCKPASAEKYVSLYTSRGFDVLQISSSLSHFLWPPNSRKFAVEIAKILKCRFLEYQNIIVHAMSIGAYNYTMCLMVGEENPDVKTLFVSRMRAVVFDSLTLGSLDHMVRGIATGMSQSSMVQTLTTSIASLYFLLTRKTTVDAFNEGIDFFKNKPASVPTLAFAVANDPMCDINVFEKMVQDWKEKGTVPVTYQIWENSGHCANLVHHRNQYEEMLNSFLASLHINSQGSPVCSFHGSGNPVKITSKL